MKNQSLFVALMCLLSACAVSNQPAPIEYNHNSYTKNRPSNKTKATVVDDGEIISKGSIESKQSDIIEPNENLAQANIADNEFIVPENQHLQSKNKIIYHEVQVGETIEDIAKKYGQTVKDIAALNDLNPPYYLDEFQVIKINQAKSSNKDVKPGSILNEENDATELTQLTTEATLATTPAVETSDAPVKQVPAVNKDFIPPVSGKILSKFGSKTNSGTNKGISISAKQGTKVLAAAGGKVIYSDYDATFGNLIIVKLDGKNTFMSYAHLDDLPLAKGASVKQGDVIGYVGASGKVNEPQLNFGIREGKVAKDPAKLIHFDK